MRGRLRSIVLPLSVSACLVAADPAAGGTPAGIVSYRLDNGLTLVVAPRPDLPLAAVNLTVGFGAADDPPGRSGLAHLLEHVSLTGTAREGSLDSQAELAALARVDAAEQAVEGKRRESGLDLAALGDLRRNAEAAAALARRLAEPGDVYGQQMEGRGAIGLNAVTGSDTTQFFCRLPSDQVGAWMSVEADRLRHPLFRHFYAERDIVLREIASLTGGRQTAQELFLTQVFPGQPAAQPVFGRPQELGAIDRPAALELFRAAYRPERVVLVVVGDVRPDAMLALARRHFGDWAPPAAPTAPVAPVAAGATAAPLPLAAVFNASDAPVVLFGFARPESPARDAAALEAVAELINTAPLSPLQARLVAGERLAWEVGAEAAVPGERFAPVFLLHAYGWPGTDARRLESSVRELLAALPATSEEDLTGAILGARVRLARALADPLAFASQLAFHQAVHGDWRGLFSRREALAALVPRDLREASRRFLSPPAATPGGGAAR
jgi:predicted Zn-dependent peptidase